MKSPEHKERGCTGAAGKKVKRVVQGGVVGSRIQRELGKGLGEGRSWEKVGT